MPRHLNVRIYGRVQGVFFRRSARRKARQLGIKGFARNEDNGTVYLEAEGEEKNLNQFTDWCRLGPFLASVKKIEVGESEIKNFNDFMILY